MIELKKIEIEMNSMTSEHNLYFNKNADKLVVIFPGGSSNCNIPILYYLTDYFIRNNYNVLCVSYNNLSVRTDPYETQLEMIVYAIKEAISQSEKDIKYSEYLNVSFSFGNIVSNELKDTFGMCFRKSIYISPTADALEKIKKHPGLVISATEDEYMKKDDLEKLLSFTDCKTIVFEGGDHGLRCADTLESIEFCKSAISNILVYIDEENTQ